MNKVNLPLFLSLIIFLATTIIVGVFGVVPLPEYGNLTSNMEFDGKIIYRVEIESQNLIPPAPDIMDECILSIDLEANSFKEEKIICSSDLYDMSYDIYFYDTEIFEDENILLRYWDESSGDEMGLIINIETKKVVDKVQQPNFYSEDRNRMNVYGEKLIDPWDTSDYSSRVIGVYYANRMENIEVFKSKAPTNYYFESLHWSPNGDYIAALDSEENFIIFTKNKKSKPGIIEFSEVNLKIFDDEEREIQNLIGWTD